MMPRSSKFREIEVKSRAELRAWLTHNHKQAESIWLVHYKKTQGEFHIGYDAIVEEALAFGWIDSLPRALDNARSMILLSPRKPKSAWSNTNKARVEKLIREKKMHASGLAKIEDAKRNGSWTKLDQVETLDLPKDLATALTKAKPAKAEFEKFSPSSRRAILEWLSNAKTDETRKKRILEIARLAKHGIRANYPVDKKKKEKLEL